jgi:hypothetical protein
MFHPNGGSMEKMTESFSPKQPRGRPGYSASPLNGAAAAKATESIFLDFSKDNKVETFVFFGLLVGLAWAPFWLGGNRMTAWGIDALLFPALTIIFEVWLMGSGRAHPIAVQQIVGPAALFLLSALWVYLQTQPIAGSLAHPIWGMASEVLGRQLDGSVSVNRGATLIALTRMLTAAAVFWLSLQLSRSAKRADFLLKSIGLIVAAYSAYGLVLTALFGGDIPFFEAPEAGGAVVRSTFVNRNSFATYAGLGLIVTTGLTLRLLRRETPESGGIARYRLATFLETTGRRGWFLLGSGLIIIAALLGTVSRGGVLATALGLFVLAILAFSRQQRNQSERIEAMLFVTAALIAGFMFLGDLIVGRIAVSGLEDQSRTAVYTIAVRSILDAPALGFGDGTFADVFPMYRDQSLDLSPVWDKAHNTYLEVWQGLGLAFGTALIIAVAWFVALCFIGAIKRRQNSTPSTIAAAAAILVAAHAVVDFSLQMQAITLTFSALLGAGVAQSISSRAVSSD